MIILLEYHRFVWLMAPHTPTKVKTLRYITLYEFDYIISYNLLIYSTSIVVYSGAELDMNNS